MTRGERLLPRTWPWPWPVAQEATATIDFARPCAPAATSRRGRTPCGREEVLPVPHDGERIGEAARHAACGGELGELPQRQTGAVWELQGVVRLARTGSGGDRRGTPENAMGRMTVGAFLRRPFRSMGDGGYAELALSRQTVSAPGRPGVSSVTCALIAAVQAARTSGRSTRWPRSKANADADKGDEAGCVHRRALTAAGMGCTRHPEDVNALLVWTAT